MRDHFKTLKPKLERATAFKILSPQPSNLNPKSFRAKVVRRHWPDLREDALDQPSRRGGYLPVQGTFAASPQTPSFCFLPALATLRKGKNTFFGGANPARHFLEGQGGYQLVISRHSFEKSRAASQLPPSPKISYTSPLGRPRRGPRVHLSLSSLPTASLFSLQRLLPTFKPGPKNGVRRPIL